jgi:hypothetical protein
MESSLSQSNGKKQEGVIRNMFADRTAEAIAA